MRHRLAGALVAAAALLVAGPPAHAAEDASISYVERTDEGLQILVDVPPTATVDIDDVAVTLDDTAAEATAAPAQSTTSVRRTAVLVIDTSNSMRGQRIEAAEEAAQIFLDTVPEDVYVGIVTFDSDVTESLPPTLDRDAARDVVDSLTLNRQTRLYDGVVSGLELAGTEGQRQLLVLSDGADTSDTPLEDVTTAVADAEVLVNVVSLEQRGQAVSALQELADAGEGTVISAEAEALSRAFSAEADVLARQVLVTAQVPDAVTASEATVSVTLGSDEGPLTAEAFSPIGEGTASEDAAPAVSGAAEPMVLTDTWLYGGLGAVAVGLLLVIALLAPRREKPMTGADLAATYASRVSRGGAKKEQAEHEQTFAQATHTAEKVLTANKSLEVRIAERLEGAGNPFKPAEWLLVHLGVFLAFGLVGLLLGAGNLALGLLFLGLGAYLPWWFLGFKRKRRRKKFEGGLPETLQLISGSLAAGLSLAQSIDTVVREGQDPIASEFRRVLVETRLGIPLDDALEGVAERFQSKDFSWVVMAIRIQRQVGGNLAELLDTVANTMREREYMRRQVAALAAEGKLSAYVLGGLPPIFMLYLLLTNRDYVMPMFTDPMGLAMLGGGVLILSVGIFWMSRLIKVEV